MNDDIASDQILYHNCLVIIDGSTGIGFLVIASIRGVNLVLIITEISIFGISTAKPLETEISICINKYDTYTENTKTI